MYTINDRTVSASPRDAEIAVKLLVGDRTDGAELVSGTPVAEHGSNQPGPFSAVASLEPATFARRSVEVARVIQDGDIVAVHSRSQADGPKVAFDLFRFKGARVDGYWNAVQSDDGPNASGRSMIDGVRDINVAADTSATRAIITSFAGRVLFGRDMSALSDFYDGDRLIQHNPLFGDGVKGMRQAFGPPPGESPVVFHQVYRVIAEGDFGLVVSRGLFRGRRVAYFDLYRVEAGRIAEHWDVIEPQRLEDDAPTRWRFGDLGSLIVGSA